MVLSQRSRTSRVLLQWPATLLLNCLVNAFHQRDCLAQGGNNLLILSQIVQRQRAALAVLEPLLTDLIASDMKLPDVSGHVFKILRLVDPDAAHLWPIRLWDVLDFLNGVIPLALKTGCASGHLFQQV